MNSTVDRSRSHTSVRYWCPLAMAFSSILRCGVTRGRLARWPRSTARDVDLLPLDVQLHGPDDPRLFESQQMAVEFDIAHGASPPDQMELEPSLHHPATH